jgi:hypothetical protein
MEPYLDRTSRLGLLHELEAQRETIMANLVDKNFVGRANTVLLLGILWSGLAVCVLGALFYDIAYWFEGW